MRSTKSHETTRNTNLDRVTSREFVDSVFSSQTMFLERNQIHVWRIALEQNPDRPPELKRLLSPEERTRADRFHFDKDRNQFMESRAALRVLLSQYLKVSPKEVTFSAGSHGKPALANGLSNNGLRFNLSRRDGLALVAVAHDREIGVDVELIRPDLPVFEIAEVSFSESEFEALRGLPENLRIAGFYNCWTRKEAYVKARGEGLSFPLDQFDVSLTPGEPARLLSVRDDHALSDVAEVDRWTLHELPVADGYAAALCCEGPKVNVVCKDWSREEDSYWNASRLCRST